MPKTKKNNIQKTLPMFSEALNYILSYLTPNEAGKYALTTPANARLFGNTQASESTFKQLILESNLFDITSSQLQELEKKASSKEPISYKKLYIGLGNLANANPPSYVRNMIASQSIPLIFLYCSNNISLLKWIPKEYLSVALIISAYAVTNNAIQAGIVQGLYHIDISVLQEVARSGNYSLLKYILQTKNNLTPNSRTLNFAAKSGNLDLIKFLLSLKDENDEPLLLPVQHTLTQAITSGNLALIDYFLALKDPTGKTLSPTSIDLLHAAESSDDVSLMQYLQTVKNSAGKTALPNSNTLNIAAKHGHFKLVRYLLDLNLKKEDGESLIKPNPHTLNKAAESGNLELVKFALNYQLPDGSRTKPDLETLNDAAFSGNIALIKFLLAFNDLHKDILQPTQDTLESAAASGKLALVKFLLDFKKTDGNALLVSTQDTLNNAASAGNLTLFKFLLSLQDQSKDILLPNQWNFDEAARSFNFDLVSFILRFKQAGKPLIFKFETNNYYQPALEKHIIPCSLAMNQIWTLLQNPLEGSHLETVKKLFDEAYHTSPIYFAKEIRYLAKNMALYPDGTVAIELAQQFIKEKKQLALPFSEKALLEKLENIILKFTHSIKSDSNITPKSTP